MATNKSIRILLVEDDEVDAMAVIRGFKNSKIANTIVHARDGVEALAVLRGDIPDKSISNPYVILLDLNMPRMDGFEFLDELRKDPQLREIIVFVLTTSKADEDRSRSYRHHVAGYVVKSNAGKDFLNLIHMIDHYWRIVEIP
jgi:CheY-like chemotaxis protein